jgi:hypothetical protein
VYTSTTLNSFTASYVVDAPKSATALKRAFTDSSPMFDAHAAINFVSNAVQPCTSSCSMIGAGASGNWRSAAGGAFVCALSPVALARGTTAALRRIAGDAARAGAMRARDDGEDDVSANAFACAAAADMRSVRRGRGVDEWRANG